MSVLIKKLQKYGFMEIEGDENDIHFTSDHHHFHKNIIRMCNRPFNSVEDMTTQLINNWNNVVKENDIVFNLGDFCWSGDFRSWINLFTKLNGKQVFITGNHDDKKCIKKITEQYKTFDEILDGKVEWYQKIITIRDRLELRHNKYRYLLDHYPMEHYSGNHYDVKMLHGHSHDRDVAYTSNHYNVSVERNEYRPISLREINFLLKKQKEESIKNLKLSDIS